MGRSGPEVLPSVVEPVAVDVIDGDALGERGQHENMEPHGASTRRSNRVAVSREAPVCSIEQSFIVERAMEEGWLGLMRVGDLDLEMIGEAPNAVGLWLLRHLMCFTEPSLSQMWGTL